MSKTAHILVATDGSKLSDGAAAYAGELARALDARVSVVIVHDEQAVIADAWSSVGIQPKDGSDVVSTEDIRRRIEQNALESELAETISAIGDLTAEPALVNLWGHPADEICDYAAKHDVDMIVIGSHGRSGIKRAILGSVSHSVANQAPCAVTIVR